MKRKWLNEISTLILAFVMLLFPILSTASGSKNTKDSVDDIVQTRTISADEYVIDYESIFKEYEDAKLETNGSLTTFEGRQVLKFSDLEELDEVSRQELKGEQLKIKYKYSFDCVTDKVTLKAVSITETENGEVQEEIIDIIEGTAFINEMGNVDAVLDVDGEQYLLSELQEVGMIENCGLFSRLFKKVVVAVVAVVAVAAVASAIVAFAGAGLGACIVAGLVSGAATGAIAGGLISYSEYGKLDWRWIAGGAVVGGVIGAVVGWGVGGAVMKTTTAQTNRLIKAAKKGDLKFSKTVESYYTSGQRPYSNSTQLVEEIMKSKNPIKDPRSATGLKWEVEGVMHTSATETPIKGVWELVVDPETQTVWHLLFRT